jgi:hypothetical protein
MAEAQHQKYLTEGMIAGQEIDINKQRHQEMILTAQRQQMQNIRNMQMARSMAVSSATNQGAQFGTGLQGGEAQIADQGANNMLDLNQNVRLANKVYSDQNQIDYFRMGISQLNSQIADDQGQMAMYGAIGQAAGPIGRIGANFFGGMKVG